MESYKFKSVGFLKEPNVFMLKAENKEEKRLLTNFYNSLSANEKKGDSSFNITEKNAVIIENFPHLLNKKCRIVGSTETWFNRKKILKEITLRIIQTTTS